MIKPRALKIGDKVAVIAPSSATDLKSVDNGEERIKALGLNPVMFPTCYRNYGHLSEWPSGTVLPGHYSQMTKYLKRSKNGTIIKRYIRWN